MKNTKKKTNQKNKDKDKKKRAKSPRKSKQSVLLSMGRLDLIFKFHFSDEDLEIPESEKKNDDDKSKSKTFDSAHYRIEDFNKISDLHFLQNKPEIWDKIQIIPNNHTLKHLLLALKSVKKKYFIDYIPFGKPTFSDDEEFFEDIFNYATVKGGLYVNRTGLGEEGHSLRFEFYHKGRSHSFGAERLEEDKKDEEKVVELKNEDEELDEEEKQNKEIRERRERDREREVERQKQEKEKKENSGSEDEEKEEVKPVVGVNIPKFTRQDCVFSKIEPLCVKYDWLYINYEDLKNITGDYNIKDLVELCYFLKKKGCKTFINFYQNSQQEQDEDDKEEKGEEDMNLAKENFNSGANNYNASNNTEEEEEKESAEEGEEDEEMKLMNNLYYIIEAYFFDTKQAIDIFDEHYQNFRTDKKQDKKQKSKIDRRKVFDYFIKGIASGTKEEVDGNKFGFFMDNFVKYVIVNCSKKKAKKMDFDCQLHPKINHNNIGLINDYKKIIKENKDYYISIFVAFLLGSIVYSKEITTEAILTSFLNAIEIIKRKVECTKNDVYMSENNIMKYRLSEKAISDQIKKLTAGDQENGFILDCVNKEKSSLKDYVALYDYHLVHYLSNFLVQRELKNKGFIDKDGYVMYDKEYKGVMGTPSTQKKPKNKEQLNKKVLNSIKQIDVASRLKDKEVDSKQQALKTNVATEQKIPTAKYCLPTKKEDKKNQKDTKKK